MVGDFMEVRSMHMEPLEHTLQDLRVKPREIQIPIYARPEVPEEMYILSDSRDHFKTKWTQRKRRKLLRQVPQLRRSRKYR